jgi:hypothetical protein
LKACSELAENTFRDKMDGSAIHDEIKLKITGNKKKIVRA